MPLKYLFFFFLKEIFDIPLNQVAKNTESGSLVYDTRIENNFHPCQWNSSYVRDEDISRYESKTKLEYFFPITRGGRDRESRELFQYDPVRSRIKVERKE